MSTEAGSLDTSNSKTLKCVWLWISTSNTIYEKEQASKKKTMVSGLLLVEGKKLQYSM